MVGGHNNMWNLLKDCRVRKVENHWYIRMDRILSIHEGLGSAHSKNALISHSCKNKYLSIYSDVVKDLLARVDKMTQQVKLLANQPDNLCSNPGPMEWKEPLPHVVLFDTHMLVCVPVHTRYTIKCNKVKGLLGQVGYSF